MALVEEVGEELARVLLLVERVVAGEEILKDLLCTDHVRVEWLLESKLRVEVLREVHQLSYYRVSIHLSGAQGERVLSESYEQVEEGRARKERLEDNVDEAVDALQIGEALVYLVEVRHAKVKRLGEAQADVVAHAHIL